MTDIKVRKGSGNYVSANPKDTLKANWQTVVRITRPLAQPSPKKVHATSPKQ